MSIIEIIIGGAVLIGLGCFVGLGIAVAAEYLEEMLK